MKRLAAAVIALILAGCASNAPTPETPRAAPASRPLSSPVSPATYVSQAASIDLFVIRASELALGRSSNAGIRDAASRLIAAHRGTAAQLSFAGRRLDLLPQATLLPQHQVLLDQLNSSGDFDRAWVRIQRSVHGEALALHSDYARRGSSPTLRPVAANAVSVEQADLALLRRIG